MLKIYCPLCEVELLRLDKVYNQKYYKRCTRCHKEYVYNPIDKSIKKIKDRNPINSNTRVFSK